MNVIRALIPLLIAAVLTACIGSSKQDAVLLFESYRDGNAEVYSIHLDGSGAVNLTNNDAYDGTPSVSPDGGTIAFTSDRSGSPNIFFMDPDGSNVRQFTEGEGYSTVPAWSPDGQRILFNSNRTYNVDVQGGHIEVPGNSKLWTLELDGSGLDRMTSELGLDMFGTWSPDGESIAFMTVRDGDPEIYLRNANVVESNLTSHPEGDLNPAWSPDGTHLAFMSNRSGDLEIYLLNLETNELTNISNAPESNEGDPSWSRDGTMLAFTSDRDGNIEVYVMNRDGSDQRRVTNNPEKDLHPVWFP